MLRCPRGHAPNAGRDRGSPSFPAALWASLPVLLAHNLEEGLTVGRFLVAHRALLPAALAGVTATRFAVSLGFVSALALLVTWLGARGRPRGAGVLVALSVQVALAANALQHLAVAVWTGGYAPGVITAVGLVLPTAGYLVVRGLREARVGGRALAFGGVVAVLATGPLLLAVHRLAATLG